jgi:hypothetical protein
MHRRIFAVLTTGLLVAGNAFAWGRKIDRSELPAAVETSLRLESEGRLYHQQPQACGLRSSGR